MCMGSQASRTLLRLRSPFIFVAANGAPSMLDNVSARTMAYSESTCLINAASSTGRCNTIQCIDSPMLQRQDHLFGRTWSEPSQGSVPAGLTQPSNFGYCFQC